jgi:hypothetical protein
MGSFVGSFAQFAAVPNLAVEGADLFAERLE